MRSVNDVPTDRRAAIRVVLRGAGEFGDRRTIDGHPVLLLGLRSDGHRDGIVWTTPRQAVAVLARLGRDPDVVACTLADPVPPPSAPLARLRRAS